MLGDDAEKTGSEQLDFESFSKYPNHREESGLMGQSLEWHTHTLKRLCVSQHFFPLLPEITCHQPASLSGHFPLSAGCEITLTTQKSFAFFFTFESFSRRSRSNQSRYRGRGPGWCRLIWLRLLCAASSEVRADSSLVPTSFSSMRRPHHSLFLHKLLTRMTCCFTWWVISDMRFRVSFLGHVRSWTDNKNIEWEINTIQYVYTIRGPKYITFTLFMNLHFYYPYFVYRHSRY